MITQEFVVSDAVKYMEAKLPENCVDLTVTSPPYEDLRNYEGYNFKAEEMLPALYRVTKPGTTKDRIAFQHPAIFPENLARDHILSWTNEGDLVLDPMCGSGTTCKMAEITNRRWLGIDVSEKYIALARDRMKLLNQMGGNLCFYH